MSLAALVVGSFLGLAACLGETTSYRWVRIADTGEPMNSDPPVASASTTSSAEPASIAVAETPRARFVSTFDATTFQRGNLHTHTNRSDGDSTPEKVAGWYRDHGYQFLVLSDHNQRTDPLKLTKQQGPGFILIGGEEVTMRGGGRKVHVNALCTDHRVGGGRFPTAMAAIEWASGRIHAQKGVVLLNHPNFEWALHSSEVTRSSGVDLLEIASGHPAVHTLGDAAHPSHETLWDRRLETGDGAMGVGVDDMHNLWVHHRNPARPGRAWVEVFAEHTTQEEICAGLLAGRLYASTGVKLSRIKVDGDRYTVDVGADMGPGVLELVASGGKVLETHAIEAGESITYRARGDEGWVRARVRVASIGEAWTPPVRVEPISISTPTPTPHLSAGRGRPRQRTPEACDARRRLMREGLARVAKTS